MYGGDTNSALIYELSVPVTSPCSGVRPQQTRLPVSAESYFPVYGDDAITQQAFSKQWRSFPEFGDEALVFVIYDTDDYFPVCRDEARRKSIKVTAFRSLFPVHGGEAGRAYSFLKKELLFPRIRG